jgi:hypothetical protein
MMQTRFPTWNRITRNLTAYIPLDQLEKADKAKDDRKVFRVVMPLTYANLETFSTYLVAAFLQEPMFPYDPRATEDIVPVALLELLVQAQMHNFKGGLALYKAIRDCLSFGIGVISPVWTKKMGYRSFRSARIGGDVIEFEQPSRSRVPLFEGNKLECWDPYRVLPDPDVPLDQIQDGEFFGGAERVGKSALINREAAQPDQYFNCKYVDHIFGESFTVPIDDDVGRTEKWGSGISTGLGTLRGRSVDIIHMYISIVPSDWGLGDSDEPEKWTFSVAGDSLVIRAKPLGLDHDMFPVGVLSPAYDGHSNTAMSVLETVHGMQELVDNLVNSWWANTRKTVNNVFVFDPELINPFDMANISESGGLIRTNRTVWGRGIKDAIEQLPIANVTERNLQNASLIISLVNDLMGATEPIQGIRRRTSERVTATEAQQLSQAGLSKMEKMARVVWLQGLHDISFMLAHQTQQLMSAETGIRIAGRNYQELIEEYGLSEFEVVTPDLIDVPFDVIANDGTIPGRGDLNAWTQMIGVVGKNKELASILDIPKMFLHWAKLSGAKDVNSFRRKAPPISPEVVPDEVVEREAQAGNLVPVNGGLGGVDIESLLGGV